MVLVDFSQVVLSSIFAQGEFSKDAELNPDLIRHIVFNCLRSYKQKFTAKYGRLVICVDNKNYWRKNEFPYYKANRKKDRDNSGLDWKMILDTLHLIQHDIQEYFPYQVLDISGAEADDLIAVLTKKFKDRERILIVSSDKDFIQLLDQNVSIYRPIADELLVLEESPNTLGSFLG